LQPRLAAEPEAGLQKAVIAVNTAIYWQALRTAGIEDRIEGSGSLLESH
jgi:maleate isomerase